MLSNDIQECYKAEFLKKTINFAVLNSGCSRNVCQDIWFKVFIESLNPVNATSITEMKSNIKLCLSYGMVKQDIKRVNFPAQ